MDNPNLGWLGAKYIEFVEKHGYIPRVFQPYNCADVSDLAPTVTASCGGTTTIGALYLVETGGENIERFADDRTSRHQGTRRKKEGLQPGGNCTYPYYLWGGYREVKILDLTKFRVRKLTPTEYGRLQAFPMEDWEQVVSDSQAYKQFGNAVTVSVVEAIAGRLRQCLEADREIPEEAQESSQTVAQVATEQGYKPLSEYTEAELLAELLRRQTA